MFAKESDWVSLTISSCEKPSSQKLVTDILSMWGNMQYCIVYIHPPSQTYKYLQAGCLLAIQADQVILKLMLIWSSTSIVKQDNENYDAFVYAVHRINTV